LANGTTVAGTLGIQSTWPVMYKFNSVAIDSTGRMSIEFSFTCSASQYVSFFTSRNYVEIGPAFKGKLSIPLIGASRNNLFQYLGAPQIKDIHWDAFQTAYGVLILYYDNADKVNKIRFSTQKASSIKLCDEYSR